MQRAIAVHAARRVLSDTDEMALEGGLGFAFPPAGPQRSAAFSVQARSPETCM